MKKKKCSHFAYQRKGLKSEIQFAYQRKGLNSEIQVTSRSHEMSSGKGWRNVTTPQVSPFFSLLVQLPLSCLQCAWRGWGAPVDSDCVSLAHRNT